MFHSSQIQIITNIQKEVDGKDVYKTVGVNIHNNDSPHMIKREHTQNGIGKPDDSMVHRKGVCVKGALAKVNR